MQGNKIKQFVMLLLLSVPAAWCGAVANEVTHGHTPIVIKETNTASSPRSSSIQASICGHVLSVVFSKDIGQVDVGIVSLTGGSTESFAERTPNGFNLYLPEEGDYLITFTLANGDEYYGEFSVTD